MAARPLRFGLIVPASNTTMEGELLGWLPPGSTCTARRIPIGTAMPGREALLAAGEQAAVLARDFPPGLEVIAYGCTAAGFLAGPEADADHAARIGAATALPVVTAAGAMVAELRAASLSPVDLVTPYPEALNRGLVAFLAAGGITVGRIELLAAPDVAALCRLTAEEVAAAARRLAAAGGDGIFIACTQLPTAAVLEGLRAACGKPVLSSNQATAAQLLRAAGAA
jgi:maleate cis-trans isomerase